MQPAWTLEACATNRSFLRTFAALCVKRFNNIKRDRRTLIYQIFIPVFFLLISIALLSIDLHPDSNQPVLQFNPTSIYASEGVHNPIVDLVGCDFSHAELPGYTKRHAPKSIHNASEFSSYLLNTAYSHAPLHRDISMFCDDKEDNRHVLFFNLSSLHSPPEVLAAYHRATTAQFLGDASVPLKIASHPYPTPPKTNPFAKFKTAIIGIMLIIPFFMIPATFISWVVKEKECKAKHLQLVSGMSYYIYWMANFVFDIASYLVTMILVFIFFAAFDQKTYIGEHFLPTFVFLLLFGTSAISFVYFVSFFFKEHSNAQTAVIAFSFVTGFLLPGAILVFKTSPYERMRSPGAIIVMILRVFPAFSLGDGLLNLAIGSIPNTSERLAWTRGSLWHKERLGADIIFMAIETVVFFALTLLLDHPSRKRRTELRNHHPNEVPSPIANEDEDVAAERQRVCQSNNEDIVTVRNFRKAYGEKVAVKNLCFGVKQGEVFGFLGTNGAGKTTTISILCGEQLPNCGQAFVNGYDVVAVAGEAQRHIGYCPQFDALLENLTCGEHLNLYAALRGVAPKDVNAVVSNLIDVVGLHEHRNTLAGVMSGGSKRKLSVAIALVGRPAVVFLDEPSAGMDPVARRGLWAAINEVARHSSVVLTTHHLEEVEALAHRVAIMDHGQLMCIGDKTHLKQKFGSGFEMSVRLLSLDGQEAFERFVATALPTAKLEEHRELSYTYSLPQQSTRISRIFRELEAQKGALGVEDYNVAQTSIESVFLRISNAGELAEETAVEQTPMAVEMGTTSGPSFTTPLLQKRD